MDLVQLQKKTGFSSYDQYIQSNHWKVKKRLYSYHYGENCVICGSTEKVHLHHNTYIRLGEERLTDLSPLCEKHHRGLHEFVQQQGIRVSRGLAQYQVWLDDPNPRKPTKRRRRRASLGPKKALRTGTRKVPTYPVTVRYDPSIIKR